MQIRDYAAKRGLKIKGLADRLGVTTEALRLIDNGERKAGPELARKIEQETGGEITASSLRPDLWPEVAA